MIEWRRGMMMEEDSGGGMGGMGGEAPAAPTGVATLEAPATPATPAPAWTWAKEDGTFNDGWADRLPEDLKGQSERLAKFASVPALMKSYVNLESKLGLGTGAVLPPTEKSTPEEIAAFRKAVGVPEAAEAYEIVPADYDIDKEVLSQVQQIAHKHNITEAGMRELMALQIANRQEWDAKTAEVETQRVEQAKKTLQDEWKGNYDRNIKMATMAAKSVGADVASDGFADPEVVKAFARLAEKLGDDKIINGNVAPSMQPGKARANEIMTNPKDPVYDDYHGKNGTARQREAAKLVTDLLKNG